MGLLRYLPVIIAAALAFGTWWMSEQARRGETTRPNSPLNPDFVVEGVRMSRMSKDGVAQTILNAARMTHIPQADLSILEQPRVMQSTPGKPPITITADHGESRNDAEQVDLSGNIVITREATVAQPALTVRTQLLHIRPDDDTATTDRDVEIVYGNSTITGTGMQFSNADRTLVVDSHARGVVAPSSARTTP